MTFCYKTAKTFNTHRYKFHESDFHESVTLKRTKKMKLTIFVANVMVVLGSPIAPNLPDKLRQYQRATGISETELLTIYQNHLSGQFVSE